MKKVICILLMWWFPLSMVTAQAMSTKMMLQVHQQSESILTSQDTSSCHNTHQQKSSPSKSHKCSVCGSCVLASAAVTVGDITSDIIYLKTTLKHLAFEPAFISIDPESFIKPPILN